MFHPDQPDIHHINGVDDMNGVGDGGARPTILVVDDEQIYLDVLSAILGEQYFVYVANSGRQALDLAVSCRPDLVLLDMVLPEMDGLQICAEFKSHPVLRDIPIIFLTSMVNTASEIEGLQSGAVDYVKKPIKKDVLKARIQLHLARRQQEAQLSRMALVDGLTGLANRAHFDKQLTTEIMRLSRLSLPVSLILLDVDFFKQYNDIYGHVGGDDCLRLVSSTIGLHINRLSDLAARVGGEEFACILPQTELAGAMVIAERIRQSVMELKVPHQGSTVADCVTVSIGVVSEPCDRYVTPQTLMLGADAQLYRAKRTGRNRVCAASWDEGAV